MNKRGLSKNFSTAYGYRVLLEDCFTQDRVFKLHIFKTENGKTFMAKPVDLVWEERNSGSYKMESSFLSFDCGEEEDRHGSTLLQALEDLFSQGKPDGRFVEGELVATKKHLEDMREIALSRNPIITENKTSPY